MVKDAFDKDFWEELIDNDYTDYELEKKFQEIQSKVPAAAEKMMNHIIFHSGRKRYLMKDVFNDVGDEMNEIKLLPYAYEYLIKIRDPGLKKCFKTVLEFIHEDPSLSEISSDKNQSGVYAYGFTYREVPFRVFYKVEDAPKNSRIITVILSLHEKFYHEIKKHFKQ